MHKNCTAEDEMPKQFPKKRAFRQTSKFPIDVFINSIQNMMNELKKMDPRYMVGLIIKYCLSNRKNFLLDYYNKIVMAIVQLIFCNDEDPEMVKYLRVLNYLLEHQLFKSEVTSHITMAYTHVFVTYARQMDRQIIQELMIMRKLWKLTVHNHVLEKIRFQCFKATKIDVEFDLTYESIRKVQDCYKSMNISIKDIEEKVFCKKHQEPQDFNIKKFTPLPQMHSIDFKNSEVNQIWGRKLQIHESEVGHYLTATSKQSSQQQTQISLNTDFKEEDYQEITEDQPNKDFISLTTPFKENFTEEEPFVSKISETNKKMFDFFKGFVKFQCNQCGLLFELKKNYTAHNLWHFQEKTSIFNIKSQIAKSKAMNKGKCIKIFTKKQTNLLTEESWLTPSSMISKINYDILQLQIPNSKGNQKGSSEKQQQNFEQQEQIEKQFTQMQINKSDDEICTFCFEKFELIFKKDKWTYLNCVRAKVIEPDNLSFEQKIKNRTKSKSLPCRNKQKIKLIHGSCFKVLEETQKIE